MDEEEAEGKDLRLDCWPGSEPSVLARVSGRLVLSTYEPAQRPHLLP